MTILHLVRSFGSKRLGGAERNIYNLANLISKETSESNIVISDFGIWRYHQDKNKFKREKRFFSKLLSLILIKNRKISVRNIHVHSNGYYIFLGYFLAIILKCRLVIKITRVGEGSLVNRKKEKNPTLQFLIKKKLFQYICKSKNVYIHILSKSSLDIVNNFTKKIIIFPNLVKKGFYNSKNKIKDTVVISSRLIIRKNIDLALDNLLSLKNRKIRVYILGDGPELDRLKNKYKNNKSIISFLGYLKGDEVYHYYKKAEYFINLSQSEGMSNSLIEAMTCGCKCIISNILENKYTADSYAIYYDKEDDFSSKIKEAFKLEPEEISNYANSKYSIDLFNFYKLKELYKIDNSFTGGR